MKFFETFQSLRETHPEWSRRVCVLAARYYLCVETHEDMMNRINPPDSPWSRPTLSRSEFDSIRRWH